jgi:hypothetical protein
MALAGAVLLGLTAMGVIWPIVLAAPIMLLAGWIGIALILRAVEVYVAPFEQKPEAPDKKEGKVL